mgnify:CR=1 FL=1
MVLVVAVLLLVTVGQASCKHQLPLEQQQQQQVHRDEP